MKIHFLLCGSGRPIFERRDRMEYSEEMAQGYGVAKALIWILAATSSQGAEMPTQSFLAKMSRAQDKCLFISSL